MAASGWAGRSVGLDVHRDFGVVAICEDGVVRSAGRLASTPEGIATLAGSLLASDRVALEVTGSAWEVARLLLTADAPKNTPDAAGRWATNPRIRDAERELARQAQASYERMVRDWQATATKKKSKAGASVTPERAQV